METEKVSDYRKIVKGTALFGGTQVFNILINIIRGKLVAILLGSVGMGISSLFTSALSPIQQFSSLGIPFAAVKDISSSEEESRKNKVVAVIRKLLLFSSLICCLLMVLFSPVLSKITFGNTDYTISFCFLSVALLFQTLNQCETTILQGYRKLKDLAFVSVIGSLCGLFVGLPLYYFYGNDGIIPALICLALCTYIFTRNATRKIGISKVKISFRETWKFGMPIIILGLLLMIGALFGNITTYSLNSFIRGHGAISDVGLYQAANSITNQYVGLVFTAMATDYYPQLSSIIKDKVKVRNLLLQESEIVLYLVAPLASIIIITAPLIIKILLTNEFLCIADIVRFLGLGIITKAACFPLGYISVAKGDKKFYFWMEAIWSNLKTFIVFASFYYIFGFRGLGYAALVSSILDIIVVCLMNKWRYGLGLNSYFFKQFFFLISLVASCLIFSFLPNLLISWMGMLSTSFLVIFFSLKQLNDRIALKSLLRKFKK